MQTSKHSCFSKLAGVQINSPWNKKRTVVLGWGVFEARKCGTKRELILFGCYWCLKSAKEASIILFSAGLMCDRQVLMIVSLQYFLKQDTFVILTYFWWVWFFYFLFFYATKFVFCQSAFVLQTNNSPTVVNAKYRYWGASLEFVKDYFTKFRVTVMIQDVFCEWKTPHNSMCLKDWMSSPSEALMNSNSTHTQRHALSKCPAVIPWRHCAYFDWTLHFDCKRNNVLSQSDSRCWQANNNCWINCSNVSRRSISSQRSPPCPHLGLGFH